MYLTKDIYNNTESFIAEMPKKQRKEYGQFFTVPSTADYMASFSSIDYSKQTSVGPMDPKRIVEIGQMTGKVSAGMIFVTAFLDFKTFKKFSEKLAWETEVWIADMPDHMIHLNGDRFIGPR